MAASATAGQTSVRPATAQDASLLLELFGALADYEQLRDELHATEAQIVDALFGERPAARALIAERGSRPAGYALFFPTFSSFMATRGIWLEDLFVLPELLPRHRRAADGRVDLAAPRRGRARAARRRGRVAFELTSTGVAPS